MEAQACYSLGNTYTLLQDYERAIDYHLKHLIIAQDLNDRYEHSLSALSWPWSINRFMCLILSFCRIGEGRACWSLGNAHTALGNHDQAMHFAEKHLEICKEVLHRAKAAEQTGLLHVLMVFMLSLGRKPAVGNVYISKKETISLSQEEDFSTVNHPCVCCCSQPPLCSLLRHSSFLTVELALTAQASIQAS